ERRRHLANELLPRRMAAPGRGRPLRKTPRQTGGQLGLVPARCHRQPHHAALGLRRVRLATCSIVGRPTERPLVRRRSARCATPLHFALPAPPRLGRLADSASTYSLTPRPPAGTANLAASAISPIAGEYGLIVNEKATGPDFNRYFSIGIGPQLPPPSPH